MHGSVHAIEESLFC